jgi:hypothetical protein
VYKLWRKVSPYEKLNNVLSVVLKIFITFNFITFTRIWFRAENMESTWQIIGQIKNSFSPELIPQIIKSYSNVFAVMIIGYVIHWLPVRVKDWYRETFIAFSLPVKIVLSSIVIFFVYQAMSSELQAFIYFQF